MIGCLRSASFVTHTFNYKAKLCSKSVLFVRGYKNHKENPLYVPFATDAERELASIRFWVAKNTNLKEVNVNCRRAYLPFWSFSFDCVVHFSGGSAVSTYSAKDPTKRKRCQVYGGNDYNYTFLEDVKTSITDAVELEPSIIETVKEIEPWGIYEQTAWDYVRAMVEVDEKRKLLQKSPILHDRVRNIYFEYKNRSVKMVMLPVVIAQSNDLHEFFTIYISGITGIPNGMSIHKMHKFTDVPLYRVDKYIVPTLKFFYQKLADSIIRQHCRKERRKMKELQKIIAEENDISVIRQYYNKKFAREAQWEDVKERFIHIVEFFNINYKSYAEEYEEFVSYKIREEKAGAAKERIQRCASEEEIKRNFRVLIMQIHPDFSTDECAEEKTKELIEAYQTLRNPEKRYLYDLSLH